MQFKEWMMSTEEYRSKRNLEQSPEPEAGGDEDKPVFVIQKHDAENLHYDLRLSLGGVLVSWAVPKGLSTAANEKRLGIRTEDHPLDYADFEGVIPEGEYGAGTVLVWDRGDYEFIRDEASSGQSMEEAIEEGSFKVRLKGEKLHGGYAFVRMEQKEDKEQWLIFKLDDQHADARRKPISTEPDSVLSGRSLEEIRKEASE